MSRIVQLIAELCPQGVEFKTLGEIGVIFGGLTGKSKADFSNGNARFVSYVNVFNNIAVNVETPDFVKIEAGERQRTLQRGDILFTGSSETADEVGMSSVITVEIQEPLYLNSFCIGYRLNDPDVLEPGFTKYLFRSEEMRKQIVRTASGVTRFNVSKARLAQVKIPIPPLEIQREIVKVLDTFTQLEAELEAELEARKKQYEYYRDELLTFGDDVEWRTLGEVGKLHRGTAITAKETKDGEIPVVANAPKPIYFHSESNRSGETIVVARSGAYAGLVSFWNQPIFLTDAFSVFPDAAMLKAKFVYYLLKQKQDTIHSMKKGSGVPHVRVKDFESYSIPIPPLAEQERIVAILDKFDALVNDISVGLPAELNARRNQYEYYRNKLLTFKNSHLREGNHPALTGTPPQEGNEKHPAQEGNEI